MEIQRRIQSTIFKI